MKLLRPDEVARLEQSVDIDPIDDPTPYGVEIRDSIGVRARALLLVLFVVGIVLMALGADNQNEVEGIVGLLCFVPTLAVVALLGVCYLMEFIYWLATGRHL